MTTRQHTVRLLPTLMLANAMLIGCSETITDPSSSKPLIESAGREQARERMAEGFSNPPPEARPRVWWHWMKGNVTRDGIIKDLDWMTSVGIGGVQNFDVDLQTPVIVDRPVRYMTDEWQAMFRFAVEEADRRGLEFAIAASPGWSETGGPWVQPEDGLKKVVWSEILVSAGQTVPPLPEPPRTTGPFQDLPLYEPLATVHGEGHKIPQLYRDIAVLAVSTEAVSERMPAVLINGTATDGDALLDDSLQSALDVAQLGSEGEPATIEYRFTQPQRVSAASLYIDKAKWMFGNARVSPLLQASDDGAIWRDIASIGVSTVPTTISFEPITAAFFRLQLTPNQIQMSNMGEPMPGIVPPTFLAALAGNSSAPFSVASFQLHNEPRLHQFETKAGFALTRDYFEMDSPDATLMGADPSRVLDLTDKLAADGTLNWTPPDGDWRILRFGYSLLGTTNHPAPPEATGLEVDKFDGDAVRRYLDTYLGMYREATGDALLGERGLQALLTDSIEVGAANWTPRMIEQFKRLRGYDPTPWLPTLAGVIIGSAADSDRFLFDYRRTLADLIASEHYATVAEVAHANGLIVYGEALEDNRPSLGDDMAMRSHADIPMSALWTHGRETGPKPSYVADMRGAASVAHVYGSNLAAAESMTSALYFWGYAPRSLRRFIDLEFSHGINRPVIHTSVHQPLDEKVPGLSLMIFGQFFNRHESWASMAKPWVDYMSRNAFMLQQGRFFADVAYFYGEEAPLTGLYGATLPTNTPKNFAYDFVNADIVSTQLQVDGNELVSKGGARYRVLYLGGSSQRMTLKTLQRIASLVESGAVVVGNAPERTPGLNDDEAAFDALVSALWDGSGDSRFGAGRLISGVTIDDAMTKLGIAADVDVMANTDDGEVLFLHRITDAGDTYFINNRLNRAAMLPIRFRVTGKVPELWHADTGRIEPISYRVDGEHTLVELDLEMDGSVHVMFSKPSAEDAVVVTKPTELASIAVNGSWEVSFETGRGGPDTPEIFDQLSSFSDHDNPAIRYFSGVATYRTTFELDQTHRDATTMKLDLGDVADLAEVRVNGEWVGNPWHAPFTVDVSDAIRVGQNELEIHVANRWVNRLVGDAALPDEARMTWTAIPTFRADAPLTPAGLLGPVTLTAFK